RPAARLNALPAVFSVRWADGLNTGRANRTTAIRGPDGRQSETTGLLQAHADLAAVMPATITGWPEFYQLLLKQWAASFIKIIADNWENFSYRPACCELTSRVCFRQ